MPFEDDDEMVIESATQTPEQIQAVLKDLGYETTESDFKTDKPAAVETPAAEPDKPVETPAAVPAVAAQEDDESEGDEEPVKPAAEPAGGKPKLSGHQRDKLKLQRAAEENAELKRRLDEIERRVPPQVEETPAPAAEDPEPDPEDAEKYPDGQFDAAFRRDHGKWSAREVLREDRAAEKTRRETETARQATERQAEATRTAQERATAQLTEAKAEHADFDEVIAANAEMPVTPAMAYAIQSSELGIPRLQYWLATHPEETAKIHEATKLPADATQAQIRRAFARASVEFDKIEEQLQSGAQASAPVPAAKAPATQAHAASEQPRKPVPVKPQPVEPVGSRSAAVGRKLSELSQQETAELTSEEYARLYKAEYGTSPFAS